jgi:hypothetical protein
MKKLSVALISILLGCTQKPVNNLTSNRGLANTDQPIPGLFVESFCDRSSWDGNFQLILKRKVSEPKWYSDGMVEHTLQFTTREDCEAESVKILRSISKSVILCGCSTTSHAGMAMSAGESWYYQQVNCMRINPNSIIENLIKNKKVIRSDWASFSQEERSKVKISDYFDVSRTGENYQLCKDKVLPETKNLLESSE